MIGLLLAGTVYWGCTVVVLHFRAFGAEMAAAASLPNIVVRLFGVQALWVACVIGYLALLRQPQYLYPKFCPPGLVAGAVQSRKVIWPACRRVRYHAMR